MVASEGGCGGPLVLAGFVWLAGVLTHGRPYCQYKTLFLELLYFRMTALSLLPSITEV